MAEKTYDTLRALIGSYLDLHPDTEGSLTEYAQWYAKDLHRNRMDTPASYFMVEFAAFIDRERSKALSSQPQKEKSE